MNKSNTNFKEKTKHATQKSTKHSNFDQTKQQRSDSMDRMNLENTTYLLKSESGLVLPQKNKICRNYSIRVFVNLMERKPKHKNKIEQIKHKFQRKHSSCATLTESFFFNGTKTLTQTKFE